MLLLACLLLSTPCLLQTDDGPDFMAPHVEAKTSTAYWAKSEGDLRYMWQLPEDYSADSPRHMTVILHGTGGDYRWGYYNNFTAHHMKLNPLRSEDILISVDGTSPGPNNTRLFLGEKKDVDAFHDFLVEIREQFAVDKIFLYGHSQGSFFVVHFASQHPEMLGGVVAHASGTWGWTKLSRKMKDLPILFLHGTKDPVVPYRQSINGRDRFLDQGLDLVALLRMPGYNHWPNSTRVTEGIDWCEGMTSDDPQRVLDLANALAMHKGADSYQYEISPALALSRQVTRRLLEDGDHPLDKVPTKISKKASKLASAIEKQGDKVIAQLSKAYKKKITLADDLPLGLLVAAREDYRGVDSVEAWYKKIGHDKLRKKHYKKAKDFYSVWYGSKKESEMYAATVDLMESFFLIEGLPWNMKTKMEEWNASPASLRLNKKTLANYESVERWIDGWELGDKVYKKLWMKWEWKD
ncbi:MAG: hypothetical protein COA70_09585 [Planctomycetota bacterium]|nr:MAG: hypothetical protein COA70_09585 [Planctomycetota bacterium]